MRQAHSRHVTEFIRRNDTELTEFLKMHSNSAGQVFEGMILACEDFSLSWFLVEWSLIAARGCLNFGGIFEEV